MSKMTLNIVICVIACLVVGCAKPAPQSELHNSIVEMNARELRLATLIVSELNTAKETFEIPRLITVESHCVDISQKELLSALRLKLEHSEFSLASNDKGASLSVTANEYDEVSGTPTAELSLSWGPRKGYTVTVQGSEMNFKRQVEGRS